ncbi:MAG: ABC transporter permease, partial [Deltaproteobacteria bacterium]|nr:ABC transporter permease [Deltaproteobacteria bacterium]
MRLRLSLAWKNLWRNRRRTLINLAAMSVGCAALMVAIALTDGLLDELQKNVTEVLCGDAQVHAPGFQKERNLRLALSPKEVTDVLARAAEAHLAAAPRAIGFGLIAQKARSAGGELMGVDPRAERAFGGLADRVESGAFLPDEPKKLAVLGQKLAKLLEAKVGDELVVVVQAADGSMGSMLLHVGGVLTGVGEGVDRSLALIDRRDFAELFSTEGVHEIALTSHSAMTPERVKAIALAGAPQADVRTYRELLPQVASLEQLWGVATWLMAIIFSLAAGLGVLNAMLMAQYERIPEFGLLKALGTTPARIVGDVLIESVFLGLVSLAAGLTLGGALVYYLHTVGLDIGGSEQLNVSGVLFGTSWKARWSLSVVLQPALVTLLT